jgi:hypothetical protein
MTAGEGNGIPAFAGMEIRCGGLCPPYRMKRKIPSSKNQAPINNQVSRKCEKRITKSLSFS